MGDLQQPVGSTFTARSTAVEVLAGIDLTGKRVIVTGGHSGLGLETTRALAGAGADVIVAAREPQAVRDATSDIAGVVAEPLDLSDLRSVAAFADRMLASGSHIDALINNAGIMAAPEARVGPGWESHFAINHLGHFALANLLRPLLEGGARVVAVSSAGHHLSPIRWDDLQFNRGYDKWLAYAQSKTANALFAVHLDRLGRSAGIRAFAAHPGKIFTPLQRHLTQDEMVDAGWLDERGSPADPSFKSPEQGAATAVWAATSPLLDDRGGLYCEDCDVAMLVDHDDGAMTGVRDYAVDPNEAERLWALSAELTGVDGFRPAGRGA